MLPCGCDTVGYIECQRTPAFSVLTADWFAVLCVSERGSDNHTAYGRTYGPQSVSVVLISSRSCHCVLVLLRSCTVSLLLPVNKQSLEHVLHN